jgi:hypothetical protein
MLPNIRNFFSARVVLVLLSFICAVVWHRPDMAVPPAIYLFALAFLTSCWCNVLLIRGGYIGKSSLVLWILVSIFGLPPLGFIAMLFVLSKSVKNIEVNGKS